MAINSHRIAAGPTYRRGKYRNLLVEVSQVDPNNLSAYNDNGTLTVREPVTPSYSGQLYVYFDSLDTGTGQLLIAIDLGQGLEWKRVTTGFFRSDSVQKEWDQNSDFYNPFQ